jgi:hypothetical protein
LVRSSFSAELTSHDAKPDAKSDAKHSYFVGILEKVRDVLKPFSDSDASASTDALEVYEPIEEFLNAPDIKRPKPTNADPALYEVDPSESLEEALIAYCMMCKDLSKIRDFVYNIWSKHVEPETSDFNPAVLAVVCNTAAEFGVEIINEVSPVLERHGGPIDMAGHYMERKFTELKITDSLDVLTSAVVKASDKELVYELYDYTYTWTSGFLQELSSQPWKGNITIYPDDNFGKIDLETPWNSKPWHMRMKHDMAITSELWFEAMGIVYCIPDYPATDEFIRGVKEFKETNKIPFSLVFAAQINLEIMHAVGQYAETSVDTLLQRLADMNETMQGHIEFHKEQRIAGPYWSARDQKWLEATQKALTGSWMTRSMSSRPRWQALLIQ